MDVQYNECYLPALTSNVRILKLYGGAGSGKSYFAGQKILSRLVSEKGHRFLLVRKVHRTIKKSQFQLLKDQIYSWGTDKYFGFNNSDYTITYKPNGNEIISCGVDDVEKLKSIHGITGIWVEETTEITLSDFLQINLRLRGKTEHYKQVILTFNPIDANHWLNKTELENCLSLKSTYLDNAFCDDEYKEVIRALAGQDENFYNIYALGEWGQKTEIIYKPFEILNEYPTEFNEVIYGLDFGYNHKTALYKIGIIDGVYYPKQLIWAPGYKPKDIIAELEKNKVNQTDYIYCDSARPDAIDEVSEAGFNAIKSNKSVYDGIMHLKSVKIYSHPDNKGMNDEVLVYSWKKDKNGNVLDEPIKYMDDALDCIRYAIFTNFIDKPAPEPTLKMAFV